ncbi:MAG: M20/M25/M40 family metallo-hydrolase [Gemmatimonadales bacterium]
MTVLVVGATGTDWNAAMNLRTTLPLWAILSTACLGAKPEIERVDVERILSTLSADSMEGRDAFGPGIEKAEDFIAKEFAAIGLDRMEGLDSYLQSFPAYSLDPESRKVVVNGRSIPDDRVAIVSQQESFHWTSPRDVEVVRIGPNDNLIGEFSARRRGAGNTLLLVDEGQKELFDRIRRFVSGPSHAMQLTDSSACVLVLTRQTRARSLDVRVVNKVTEHELTNVVGVIPGKRADEIVLFSGHYDHIGIRSPVEGDSIANGANDDASGTTAVIELARYFKALGKPERTLMFATFTAEEVGGFGSRYFSQQLDPDGIVAMFNIEMIGKPGEGGPNTAWITGFDKSDFGEILSRAVEGTEYSFYADPYPDENLFYRSDNATLARLGVPAHSISTTPIDVDTDYHRVSDEIATLDLDHVTNTIKAIAKGAATIISGEATPSRVAGVDESN